MAPDTQSDLTPQSVASLLRAALAHPEALPNPGTAQLGKRVLEALESATDDAARAQAAAVANAFLGSLSFE